MDITTADSIPRGGLTVSLAHLAGMMRRLLSARLVEEPWVAEARLRPPSFGVLLHVEQLQPVSQKRVSERLGIDPSDLVAIVDLLEDAGFISRERDPEDRRRYALSLTELGETRLRRFQQLAAEVSDELFAVLEPEERETLARLVQRVVEKQVDAES